MNYGSTFSNVPTKTKFKVADLEAPHILLDRIATYNKIKMVTCDGIVTYSPLTGRLSWTDDIHIYFNRKDGDACHNEILFATASFIDLTDNQFAYVDLNETDDSEVTVSAATVSTNDPSNYIAFNRLVLGYRNTDDDRFYPVALTSIFAQADRNEQAQAFSATPTFDWSIGKTSRIVQTADVTASTFSGMTNGEIYMLEIEQDSTPGWTWAWDANIKWAGASAPTVSAGANNIDVFEFVKINDVIHGRIFSQISS